MDQETTGGSPGAGEVAQGAEAPGVSSSLVADEAAGSSLVEDERGGLVEVIQEETGRPPGAGEVDQKAEEPRASSPLEADVVSSARFFAGCG